MQRKRPCFHIWSCQVMIGQINKANRKQSASSPRRSYDVEFGAKYTEQKDRCSKLEEIYA